MLNLFAVYQKFCQRKESDNLTGSYPRDIGAQKPEPMVNILVTPVDLVDVVDDASTLCGKSSDQQCDSGPDIWRGHPDASERGLPVKADNRCPVWIA